MDYEAIFIRVFPILLIINPNFFNKNLIKRFGAQILNKAALSNLREIPIILGNEIPNNFNPKTDSIVNISFTINSKKNIKIV